MNGKKESMGIRSRRILFLIFALCFFYISAGIVGMLSAYKEDNKQKKVDFYKLYVLVSGDPKHGGEKPCSLCKAAIEAEIKKMKESKGVRWQGDVLEVTLPGKKFSAKVLKRIRDMGFKAEILTTR